MWNRAVTFLVVKKHVWLLLGKQFSFLSVYLEKTFLWHIRVNLKNSMFWEGVSPHFLQFLMLKERSSGVRMPNYGEMKGKCLT